MQRQIIETEDGSHTLFVPELNEHYHSVHGAVNESNHVFIKNGFRALQSKGSIIKILEVGLGTGLNAFLTFLENLSEELQIHYSAIECYPIDEGLATELNYAEQLNAEEHQHIFNQIHHCQWEEEIRLAPNFILKKLLADFTQYELKHKYDLVYFDAFAPDVQPELWTQQVFEKVFRCLVPNGTMLTYCAKGEVKRALKAAGFVIESLAGPVGKREITRARKVS